MGVQEPFSQKLVSKLPLVTIVGRPNVGKSSIFNRLARRRISIVDPTSGVTRDRVSTELRYDGKAFELVDTGGIGIQDVEEIAHLVEAQIEKAIEEASLLVFVVEAREGLVPLDSAVSEKLRHVHKPVLLVANKIDDPSLEYLKADFFSLGFGEALSFSALSGLGRTALLEEITALLPETAETPREPFMRLAVMGRRNVGKSTLINTLAREERMIVSEIPGTTRDSVDVRFELKGKSFVAIDTAGVRKKKQAEGSVEFYGLARAMKSVRRADVVLFLLDAAQEVSQVDKKLGAYIAEQFKPCIIVINKWDLAKGVVTEEFSGYVRSKLPGLAYAPLSFISAKRGDNVLATVELAEELFQQANTRVSTSELNKILQEALARRPAMRAGGKEGRVYFGTQVSVAPPTFVFFVNYPNLFDANYERFLSNRFRDHFPFSEVPIRFFFRMRKRVKWVKG